MRPVIVLPLIAGLSIAAGPTQTAARRTPAEAAAAFSLDPAAQPTPAPTPSPEPVAVEPAAAPTAGAVTLYTLDTPIGTLIGDPGAKGVLDRDLPGLSSDANLDKFRGLSLRQFQPLTGGQLTASLMAKVAGDLAALAGLPSTTPAPVAGRKTRRGDTGR